MKRQIIAMMALAVVLGGCSFQNSELSEDTVPTESISAENTQETVDTGSTEEAVNEATDDAADTQADSSMPFGVYAREVTEEIEGSDVTSEVFYSFHEDGTGIANFQDWGPITFDDKTIDLGYKSYEYQLDGDVLTVKGEFGDEEYTKKSGDDFVVNGDFTEFAGKYKETDASVKARGNEPADEVEVEAGAVFVGDKFTLSIDGDITKDSAGAYHFVLLTVSTFKPVDVTIYPKGVIDDKDADQPELKDSVYMRAVFSDSEEIVYVMN